MTPHRTAGTASRHAAALRWVAGQLAWEDRLDVLRDDSTADHADRTDTPVPATQARRSARACKPAVRRTARTGSIATKPAA